MRALTVIVLVALLCALPLAAQEPSGWYAGDMHVHRSCGGSPITVSSVYSKMSTNRLAFVSLLADMGNGEVQNPKTDLPLVNGQDASVSTASRVVHWDAEWHWDATYSQYAHQALGGHILALGLTEAHQIWDEYTYPIIDWAHRQGGIAGFAHMEYLDNSIPTSLDCCTPIEYPVEVALGSADFISEDVYGSEAPIQAYYRLLNTGFRPGFAAGTDYPCNGGAALGSLLTYAKPADGTFTYRGWVDAIAKGRTVVTTNGHNEFLDLKVNSTAGPGDQVSLPAAATVPVSVTWTSRTSVTGTVEIVSNGVVVASKKATLAAGGSTTLTANINFPKSGWIAARRMASGNHKVHTGAVFVIVNNLPIRVSASDAQFYIDWMDNLIQRTSPGGDWNDFFPTKLNAAQTRYQAAKAVFQQVFTEAGGSTPPPPPPPTPGPSGQTIFTSQSPSTYESDSAYELGTKFWADVPGQITAVRLFTNSSEGGNHSVRIWQVNNGVLLAGPYTWSVTSGTSGWKTFTLPTPLTIAANTDYIVAISNGPDRNYAELTQGFSRALTIYNLHTYVGSGVYTTSMGTMPKSTWENTAYFRDIVFVPAQ